jgi:hypothetical protein
MPEHPRFARVELSVPSKELDPRVDRHQICFERRRRRSSVLVIKEAETEADFSSPVLETLLAIRRIRLSAVIRARNLASHAASPRSLPRLSR